MAHNEDLPQSAIDGQTPEGGGRREGLPSIPPMADLEPQRQNPQRDARGRRNNSPCRSRSQSPKRQRRRIDPQALEDRVKEQDELIRKMAADMEAMKCQIKGKRVATGEGRKGNTPPRHSEDRGRHTTPSQLESRSLRTSDTQSRTSRTRYSRSERTKSLRSYTEGSTYLPSHTHKTSSRQTELPRLSDLRTVLEERARQKEDARGKKSRGHTHCLERDLGEVVARMQPYRYEYQYPVSTRYEYSNIFGVPMLHSLKCYTVKGKDKRIIERKAQKQTIKEDVSNMTSSRLKKFLGKLQQPMVPQV
ncbi:hypothetical protein HYC85_029118 [Camellia sinensis]|uniref:Uncharacterized protein n=1 Tax=Camellia sinensis TaxID=4442 RepID=A0A7J7FXS2_CAMSI|nr:hypothetical protein HYC85_029118 [Camellia sinensis]